MGLPQKCQVVVAFIFPNCATIIAAGASTGPRKAMHARNFNIIICGCLFALGQFGSATSATTELLKMRDCTEIELEAVIDQDASREDNLARLSQQFFQSVNTIDHCDRESESDAPAASSPDSDSASSQDAASDTASESGGADGENASSPEADSPPDDTTASQIITPSSAQSDTPSGTATASGSLVGTNFEQDLTESAASTASDMAGTTPQPTAVDTGISGAQNDAAAQDLRLTNVKTPDDIPDADNDSVFEAQIRAAAMAETDPDTKKNLWNEYRRYKGLPEQE
jgi:hypothetical protein